MQAELSLDYEFWTDLDGDDEIQTQSRHDIIPDQLTLSPSSRLIAKERLAEMYSDWWRFRTILEHLRKKEKTGAEKIRRFELKVGLNDSGEANTLEFVAGTCAHLVTREAIRISVRNTWRTLDKLGSPYTSEADLMEAMTSLQNMLDLFGGKFVGEKTVREGAVKSRIPFEVDNRFFGEAAAVKVFWQAVFFRMGYYFVFEVVNIEGTQGFLCFGVATQGVKDSGEAGFKLEFGFFPDTAAALVVNVFGSGRRNFRVIGRNAGGF